MCVKQFEHTLSLSLSLSARLMWVAGMLAASASIIYPAISAMVSRNAEPEQQGVVLGILTGWLCITNMLSLALYNGYYVHRIPVFQSTVLDCLFFVLCTFLIDEGIRSFLIDEDIRSIDEDIRSFLINAGIRGLCNGLGPALFGLLFWLSDVHLSDSSVNIDPALAGAQATDIPAKTNTTAASIPHLDKVSSDNKMSLPPLCCLSLLSFSMLPSSSFLGTCNWKSK